MLSRNNAGKRWSGDKTIFLKSSSGTAIGCRTFKVTAGALQACLIGKMSEWEREWLKAAAVARSGRKDCQEDVSIDFLTVTYGQLRLVATDCKGTEWILDQGGGALTIGRRDTQVLSCRVTSAM